MLFGYSLGAVSGERLRGRRTIFPRLFDVALVLAGILALVFGPATLGGRPLLTLGAAFAAGVLIHCAWPATEGRVQPQ